MAAEAEDGIPWEDLFARAERVVARTMRSLPRPVRAEAEKVSTLLEKWPAPEHGDFLGLFEGFEPDRVSAGGGPIFIFLGPVFEWCEEEGIDFEQEVRITYLHELGHHLGLDEDDLEERGLA